MTNFHSGADFKPHRATCPSCGGAYLQDQPWKRVCLRCYLRTKAKAAPTARATAPAAEPIPADMLRRLVQLCHPDKHQGSEAATIATRYLLALKGAAHG